MVARIKKMDCMLTARIVCRKRSVAKTDFAFANEKNNKERNFAMNVVLVKNAQTANLKKDRFAVIAVNIIRKTEALSAKQSIVSSIPKVRIVHFVLHATFLANYQTFLKKNPVMSPLLQKRPNRFFFNN